MLQILLPGGVVSGETPAVPGCHLERQAVGEGGQSGQPGRAMLRDADGSLWGPPPSRDGESSRLQNICITEAMPSHLCASLRRARGTKHVAPKASTGQIGAARKLWSPVAELPPGPGSPRSSSGLPGTRRPPPASRTSGRCCSWGRQLARCPLLPAASFSWEFVLFSFSLQLIQKQGGHAEPGAEAVSKPSPLSSRLGSRYPGVCACPTGARLAPGDRWPHRRPETVSCSVVVSELTPHALSTSSPSSRFPGASSPPVPRPVLPSFP